MNVIETALPGVLIFEPKSFGDERGFFVETFRASVCSQYGIPAFVQDNQSRSRFGVLRGLHYQLVQPQGKLVRAARGRVLDAAVDVRRGSPTFGEHVVVELDDVTHRQLYIPPGFAHGFAVLSEIADFVYKCTDYYHPASEAGVRWDDPRLALPWPAELKGHLQVSQKDAQLPLLDEQRPELLPKYPE